MVVVTSHLLRDETLEHLHSTLDQGKILHFCCIQDNLIIC